VRNVYQSRLCLSVCPLPHSHTTAQTLMQVGGNDRGAPSGALLGRFAIGAQILLLWQHSQNAKCQRVLVLALCLILLCPQDGCKVLQSLCLSVCLSACISQKPHVQTSQNFLRVLLVSMAQSTEDNAIYTILSGKKVPIYFNL